MAGLLSYKHWAYWLAAIIDGEGYICVDRRRWTNGQAYYSVSVGVKNTHLGLLEQVQRVAGCGSIRPAQSRAGSKTVYVWLAHGPNTTPILNAIHRLLVVKGEQARLALVPNQIGLLLVQRLRYQSRFSEQHRGRCCSPQLRLLHGERHEYGAINNKQDKCG